MPSAPYFRNDPAFKQWLQLALEEDVGAGDVTSELLLPQGLRATLVFQSREPMVVAGLWLIEEVLALLGSTAEIRLSAQDGDFLPAPARVAEVVGEARTLLTAERLILNLLQRLSGVATLTRRYVEAVAGTGVQILDTRKTMPGMRLLDKYAVTCGGGVNHRMRLDDRILIKDNHIAVCGGIAEAIHLSHRERSKDAQQLSGEGDAKQDSLTRLASSPTSPDGRGDMLIEIECDTLEQVAIAAAAGVDWILLDNMPPPLLRQAVALVAGRAKLEASGGVNLSTVRAIAETGVDAISVGALTHSAPAVDIGLDIRY